MLTVLVRKSHFGKRPVLQAMLKIIRSGDELVVWKIDTSMLSGTAFVLMLGVFVEFETNIRTERQAIGIAKAKAKAEGRYKGKRANIAKHAEGRGSLESGYPVSEIVKLTETCNVRSIYFTAAYQ